MKKKIIFSVLTAILLLSSAIALIVYFTLNKDSDGGDVLPPVAETKNLDIRVEGADGHYYGVVYGLGTITSTDIEIPATYDFGGEYGELPVEVIMQNAFTNTAITSVTMPATIRGIGDKAFRGCSSLTTVTMENGTKQVDIGRYVFENCTALTSVTLSDSITNFTNNLFKNCTSLKSLTLPDNLCAIEEGALDGTAITYFDTDGCENFDWSGGLLINKNTTGGYIAEYANPEATEVTVMNGVTILNPELFKNNKNIRKVDLNGTELFIGYEAFANSSLEELLNYENVTNAYLRDFEGTPWLDNMLTGTKNLIMGKVLMLYRGEETDFTVPDGIETIGARAFEGTDVQSVTLPESIDEIGSYAFKDCKNLESVILNGRPPYLASDNIFPEQTVIYVPAGWLAYYKSDIIWKSTVTNQILPNPATWLNYTLSDDQTYYIVSYLSATGDVEIPESYNGLPVKAIGDRAFYGISSITGIKIPNSITIIGDEAFSHCTNLKSITIPESVVSMGDSVFESCINLESVNILYGVTAIGYGTFKSCKSLENISIANSVVSIGNSAFGNCENLKSIAIPDSVTSIGENVFLNCRNLKNANIPNGVTAIGSLTFYGCSSLEDIELPESVTSIGDSAFWNCSSLENIEIPNGVTSIEQYCFFGCSGLKNVIIPGSVTSIGKNVFEGCTGIESITVPSTEITIKSVDKFHLGYLFAVKNYIEPASVPASLKTVIIAGGDTITAKAFYLCSGITSVIVADSVSSIGEQAFWSCTNLKSVVFGENSKLIAINNEAFWKCGSLESVTIPESVTYIGERAFNDCASLVSVTIPESVTHIGDWAFGLCESLASVTIPKNVTHIGRDAFTGCNSLVEVTFEITEGWRVYASIYESNISSDDLKDTKTASRLLTETYSPYTWERI